MTKTISAIVPTVGRAESLGALLESLLQQRIRPGEVLVADASRDAAVRAVVDDPRWSTAGLTVRRLEVAQANAVGQRKAAIALAQGAYLLLLDDDVVLEPGCLEALLRAAERPGVVAVTADFSNQPWSGPTVLWRWVLRYLYRMEEGAWQGRVIGPLLRFGYRPSPSSVRPMQWLGSGNSLVRRDAYDRAGGFSDFFLHACTINEDVDLGLKLGRVGDIVLEPAARMAHMHAPGGRATVRVAAEDDLYNRYLILRHTTGRSAYGAFALVCFYCAVETLGNLGGSVRRTGDAGFLDRLAGRLKALMRILTPSRSNAI